MNILSLIIFATGLMWAILKKKGMLDSVSECAYIMPHWVFSVWIFIVAILLLPFLCDKLIEWLFLGFISILGILIVSSSGYYKTEFKILHYTGGCISFIASLLIICLTIPKLLLLWIPLIIAIIISNTKNWLFYIELLGYLMILF